MWLAARVLVCAGVSGSCGFQLYRTRTADAEEYGSPLYMDNLRQCPYLHWDWNWDRRATLKKPKHGELPEIDEKQYSNHSRHVICVSSGLCFKMESSTITGLQRLGRFQVINLTKTLMNSGQHFRNIYHSPIQQDRETAEMIFEGTSSKQPKDPPKLIADGMLQEGPTIVPIPLSSSGLPNQADLFQEQVKIEAAFRKLFYRLDKSYKEDVFDIIVAQPDVIKYFICRALQLPPEALSRFHLNWASITWITIAGNGMVTAFAIGDSGYQPPGLLAAK